MKRKMKRVYKCQVGKCYNAQSLDDCYGSYICDQCELCTSDGMVVTKVKKDDIIYNIEHVSADEIIIFSNDHKKLLSISPDTEKFSKEFKIVETRPDYRKGGCPPEFAGIEAEIKEIYKKNGWVYEE